MNYDDCIKRYHNDSMFHQLVDVMENLIHTLKMTPTEVREAPVFACILHEERKPPEPILKQSIKGPICTCPDRASHENSDCRGKYW